MVLADAQRFVPLPTDAYYQSLSAILMDEECLKFTKDNRVMYGNLPLLNIAGLIVLKIAAYLDMAKRIAEGQHVDSRDIGKHRTDIFVLSYLQEGEKVRGPDSIKRNIELFLDIPEIQNFDNIRFRQILNPRGLLGENISVAPDQWSSGSMVHPS